jgi:predicted HAD superfamily Cof-like phosphohydrolase
MNKLTMTEMVQEFHDKFEYETPTSLSLRDKQVRKLRIKLIEEELEELKEAIADKDIVEIADALADILYVTIGAAQTFGIDIDAVFEEVHRSNMTKLGDDGKPIYNGVNCELKPDKPYGKILKGNSYSPPDIAKILGMKNYGVNK